MIRRMDNNEYAASSLEDCRKVIAALKLQRWEVVKWTIATNFGLATASAFTGQFPVLALLIAVVVAFTGMGIMVHLFWRLTNTRNDTRHIDLYLEAHGVPELRAIHRKFPEQEYNVSYEWQELVFFLVVIVTSVGPAVAVYWNISPSA